MKRTQSQWFFSVLHLLLPALSYLPLQAVQELTKVFYHAGGSADSSIELGTIVFYFSKDKPLPAPRVEKKTPGTLIFTFEGSTAHQAVVTSAQALLQAIDKNICTAHLEVHRGKKPSISLCIAYNPALTGFESALFDAIQHERGFSCTLLNTVLLQRLSPHQNTILRTVSHTRNPGIVIDMGHGGEDQGAVSLQAIPEKNITHSIGLKLSALLTAQGFNVFYTRSDDTFVPLDARTSFFNQCQNADILVSIHANSGQAHASGVETFCHKPMTESGVFSDSLSTHQRLMRNKQVARRNDQSLVLAQFVQDAVVEAAKKKQHTVANRGVKKAVSQMLLGSIKPTILIETGFVTHPVESALLVSEEYQQDIARGMCKGICAYFKKACVVS